MAPLIERFRNAYADPSLVVLEGFHALKHAYRFGAELLEICCSASFEELASALAPDLLSLAPRCTPVASIDALSPRKIATGVIAVARRPAQTLADRGPVVLLEDPRHLGNVGAVVRVAAAASAAGVLVTGPVDPWHPECVRGAAGLQFALPVLRASLPLELERPLVAFDPAGESLESVAIAPDAVLAFGTERAGLSEAILSRADAVARIPMREGVSSLNLATAVAVALYHLRLCRSPGDIRGRRLEQG